MDVDAEIEQHLARFVPRDRASGVDREVGKRWFDAVRSSDFVTMKDLHEICPKLVWYRGGGTSYGFIGSTALHWAAARGSDKTVLWLLRLGAEIDAQNNGGSTPLHSACSNGQPSTLRILLQAGANVTLCDCCGDLPQDVALPSQAKPLKALVKAHSIEATLRLTPADQWTVGHMKQALIIANVPVAGISEKSELRAAVTGLLGSLPEPQMDPCQYQAALSEAGLFRPDVVEEDPEDAADRAEAEAAAVQAKEKGNEAYRKGDTKTAIKWYTMAVTICPRNAVYFANRAAAYMTLEKFDLALSDGKKAVECDPEWPKGHYRKGCALLQQGQAMEALWAFSTACKLSHPPTAELINALEHAKQLVSAEDEEEEDEDEDMRDDIDADIAARLSHYTSAGVGVGDDEPDPPRVVPRHDWFDCTLCENRTRDYATTDCCGEGLCGTCKRRASGCPYRCR